jgi:uncharacterized membrane protein
VVEVNGTEDAWGQDVRDFREIPLGPRARRATDAVRGSALWLARHWLALANGVFLAPLVGATAVPLMMAGGLAQMADPLFAAYRLICHQLPYRSFFLQGHQMAMCQRDVAIYGTMAGAGILFTLMGRGWRPLPWKWYLVLLMPIALDGITQLLGVRESNWELRLLTGALFAVGTAWLAYPQIEQFTEELLLEAGRSTIEGRDREI